MLIVELNLGEGYEGIPCTILEALLFAQNQFKIKPLQAQNEVILD